MQGVARIAVVGAGWWATTAHLPALVQNPRAELTAIVDPDPGRLAAAAAEFRPQATFPSLDALLDGAAVDAVVIAVPHSLHHPLALRALERGLHVLVEKPMVLDPAHGRALVALARERGAELVVGYPWHYNRQALELRRRIAAGEIGEVEHVSCLFASVARALYRGDPRELEDVLGYTVSAPLDSTYADPELAGGGQGQTQVTHAAALLLWLTGLDVRAVSAFTASSGLPVDLSDAVAIEFSSGAVGVLGSTGAVSGRHPELLEYRLLGTGGHCTFDVNEGAARMHRADSDAEPLAALAEADRYPLFAPADNLVEIVLGAAPNGSPAEIGLAAVEFVWAMYRSAATRSAVAIGAAGRPENVGHVWRVRPGRAAEYAERHATVWPEVERLLRAYGVRGYTIYAWGETLFSHMQVDDYLRLASEYGRDPIAERWEQEMGDLLEYPNADPETGWPERATEIWSL